VIEAIRCGVACAHGQNVQAKGQFVYVTSIIQGGIRDVDHTGWYSGLCLNGSPLCRSERIIPRRCLIVREIILT
jgi:hypothetical protein